MVGLPACRPKFHCGDAELIETEFAFELHEVKKAKTASSPLENASGQKSGHVTTKKGNLKACSEKSIYDFAKLHYMDLTMHLSSRLPATDGKCAVSQPINVELSQYTNAQLSALSAKVHPDFLSFIARLAAPVTAVHSMHTTKPTYKLMNSTKCVHTCAQQHTLFTPVQSKVKALLLAYAAQKQQHPHTTHATFLVPKLSSNVHLFQ